MAPIRISPAVFHQPSQKQSVKPYPPFLSIDPMLGGRDRVDSSRFKRALPLKEWAVALSKLPELESYNKNKIMRAYYFLKRGIQQRVSSWMRQIKPREMAELAALNCFGIFSEMADWNFTRAVHQAKEQGILTNELLAQWLPEVKRARKHNLPFGMIFAQVQKSLSDEQVTKFEKILRLKKADKTTDSQDKNLGRQLLALIILMCNVLVLKGEKDDILQDTERQAKEEQAEFLEMLTKYGPLVKTPVNISGVLLGAKLFGETNPFSKELQAIQIIDFNQNIMFNYAFEKIRGRVEFCYETLPSKFYNYQKRKMFLKPFEALLEGLFIKRAKNQKRPYADYVPKEEPVWTGHLGAVIH